MTDKPEPKPETTPKPLTWPDHGEPQPTAEEVLAPLVVRLDRHFKIARKRDAPAAEPYEGFPVTTETCDDPELFLSDEHARVRAQRGLALTHGVTLLLLLAFELGAEHARRSVRPRAPGGSVGGGFRGRKTHKTRKPPNDGRFY